MTATAEPFEPPPIQMVAVDSIVPSPLNRACADDDQGVLNLAASIREVGLINPIDVRPAGGGRFEIICGERRWRAFRRLNRAEIPCIVKDIDNSRAQLERITENLQRQDLSFMEQGEGVAVLLDICGNDYAEVASRLGYSESWVRRRARLPGLVKEWREELARPDTEYGKILDSVERLEEVAMLPPETQRAILADGLLRYVSTTAEMRKRLARWFMNLDNKPWSRDWEKKTFSSVRRCDACAKRSDREQTLFDALAATAADGGGKARLCLDPDCWAGRVMSWCKDLVEKNPAAPLVYDGYPTPVGLKLVRDAFGRDALSGSDWHDGEVADYDTPAKAVCVGGNRMGELLDVWLRNAGDDEAFDDDVRRRRAEEKRRREVERERAEAIEAALAAALAAAVPEDIDEVRGRVGMPESEMACNLVNWCVWYGVGSIAYDDGAEEFDPVYVGEGSCQGLRHAWSQVRGEILDSMFKRVSGDALPKPEAAIVAFVATLLAISIEEIAEKVDAGQAGS